MVFMTLTKEMKKYAKILFGIYMFCLFWIVILKCNLRQGVLECRYTWSKVPLNARMSYFLGRFATTDLKEALINVFIFTPVGLVFPLIREKKPILTSAILGFSISLFAEVFQLITCVGGFTYIDIINNTLGAVIGSLICILLLKFVNEKQAKIILLSAITFGVCLSAFAIVNTIINIDIYFCKFNY